MVLERLLTCLWVTGILQLLCVWYSCTEAMATGRWGMYDRVQECASNHNVPAAHTVVGQVTSPNNVDCLLKCVRRQDCGSIQYDESTCGCSFLDINTLPCDLPVGVIQKERANYCSNGGSMVGDTCDCDTDHWFGPFCDIDIHAGNDCEGVNCQNGGTCQDLFNAYVCHCTYEWTGNHCETPICDTTTCYNDGTCSATPSSTTHWMCSCAVGYTGTNCETDVCTLTTCYNYATCVHSSSTAEQWACECVAGFSGTNCQTENGPVFVSTLGVSVSDGAGSWGSWASCATGTYFSAFQLKGDWDAGTFSDDKAETEVDLHCYRPLGTESAYTQVADPNSEGDGSWQSVVYCQGGRFITQFRQYVQSHQGWTGDNVGAVNFGAICRGPGMDGTNTSAIQGQGSSEFPDCYWTSYSSACPTGTAACSVRVKTADNYGISDVELRCCDY